MARIITKEHAIKIAKKLKASILEEKAHSFAEIFEEGKLIARFRIRRGSEKDKGHDHVQKDLHVNGHRARLLAARARVTPPPSTPPAADAASRRG
jgi:hypothetical protein